MSSITCLLNQWLCTAHKPTVLYGASVAVVRETENLLRLNTSQFDQFLKIIHHNFCDLWTLGPWGPRITPDSPLCFLPPNPINSEIVPLVLDLWLHPPPFSALSWAPKGWHSVSVTLRSLCPLAGFDQCWWEGCRQKRDRGIDSQAPAQPSPHTLLPMLGRLMELL